MKNINANTGQELDHMRMTLAPLGYVVIDENRGVDAPFGNGGATYKKGDLVLDVTKDRSQYEFTINGYEILSLIGQIDPTYIKSNRFKLETCLDAFTRYEAQLSEVLRNLFRLRSYEYYVSEMMPALWALAPDQNSEAESSVSKHTDDCSLEEVKKTLLPVMTQKGFSLIHEQNVSSLRVHERLIFKKNNVCFSLTDVGTGYFASVYGGSRSIDPVPLKSIRKFLKGDVVDLNWNHSLQSSLSTFLDNEEAILNCYNDAQESAKFIRYLRGEFSRSAPLRYRITESIKDSSGIAAQAISDKLSAEQIKRWWPKSHRITLYPADAVKIGHAIALHPWGWPTIAMVIEPVMQSELVIRFHGCINGAATLTIPDGSKTSRLYLEFNYQVDRPLLKFLWDMLGLNRVVKKSVLSMMVLLRRA